MAVPITGTGDTRTGQRVDPFPTFKYYVEIGGLITEAAFSECSGLEMTTELFEYAEGGLNEYVHKLPGRTKVSNVTLKRGLATSNELYKWYKEMETKLRTGEKLDLRQVTITLYTTVEQGKQMRWTLSQAFPVKWVGPSFKTDEAAVAIESLEFAHHGIAVE
ncbi:MAG: phage tail protein [Dehalococcoidia bacterium]|nr:phage tail protein [Dehalococcoidia bacterium]